jgi:hypothetical protein
MTPRRAMRAQPRMPKRIGLLMRHIVQLACVDAIVARDIKKGEKDLFH